MASQFKSAADESQKATNVFNSFDRPMLGISLSKEELDQDRMRILYVAIPQINGMQAVSVLF